MNRRLVVSYVLLVAVAIAAFTVPVAFVLTGQLRGDVETSVRREAATAALLLAAPDVPSRQALARLAAAYEQETPGRLDALLADGTAAAPLPLPAAPDDPAFAAALTGREDARWGEAVALGAEGLVLAVPARDSSGAVVGAVRVSYPAAPLDERQLQIWGFRAILAVAVLIVAAILGALLARRLTRPFRELNGMAQRLRDGDLGARVLESGPTETRTLARTLNTAAETIDTLVRSQRAFIADASHQLRTPLTALRLSLDNVADGVSDPLVREDIDLATAEVVRMNRLVNGLLVLARAETAVGAPERVRVADVVDDRFEVWRAVAAERAVVLRAEHGDGAQNVSANPGNLEQILDNVLSNAIEVSPAGGAVTVRTSRSGEDVLLDVTDEGPGLPAADRHRAFDRFWRGAGTTGPSGSGLGLAIVKQLVTDDGGTVALTDAVGGGLCVRISLRAA
ncbi:HAMP domain-containing sensor histidine kinase [Amycolatopsis sp. EV170708-02-1]|uniref:sensor histidine kinase n=1 Tax=Amycolatopsis sp. EV170708-02-1 TaxID=2919322 RepID=UPI001F0C510E|nr:HAMP domain-containing sensor histidine kinase [Amycolatopsis sp. EV170708-02-1]UMO99933.1 HAMP domain-containing histidine kinase [Amycolatopsis sp. EV170708-02-1]